MRRLLPHLLVFLLGGIAGYLVACCAIPVPVRPAETDLRVVDGGIYHVRKVIDGDTIILNNGVHVRYHGINAPEMGRYVKDPDPLGREATARNLELLRHKRVRLRLASSELDQYGRILARVYAVPEEDHSTEAETDVETVLLKEGLCRVLPLGLSPEEARELKACEDEARAAKAGLWGVEDKARDAGKPYCAAAGSNLYHLATCSLAQRIKGANRHEYSSSEEAEAVGLKPCSRCIHK